MWIKMCSFMFYFAMNLWWREWCQWLHSNRIIVFCDTTRATFFIEWLDLSHNEWVRNRISVVATRGVGSLKFLTPTPLLLRLNILRHTFQSFGLQLLLKLQSELSKLLAVSKRPYPVFALKRRKNRSKSICWSLQYVSVASQIKD